MKQIDLKRVLAEAESAGGSPPIHLWNPDLSGEIDIVIKKNGDWYHEGVLMQRHSLVKLFASILRCEEDGNYYLVTPVEKWRISVEDLPLTIVAMEVKTVNGEQQIQLVSNLEDVVTLDDAHPLAVGGDDNDEPKPELLVRDRLRARIARSVYYQLVALAEECEIEGELCACVRSCGKEFSLGRLS